MRKRRVHLHHLRSFDLQHDAEIVRELEMTVEGNVNHPGHALQFWQDVTLYGVDEAILYVRNGGYGNADAIAAEWTKLQTRFDWNALGQLVPVEAA